MEKEEIANRRGLQFFDNCSVKSTDEAVANRRRTVTPRYYILFCIQSLRCPSAISFTWPSGSQWLGSQRDDRVAANKPGLPGKGRGRELDSCAGFYHEDEWVNR